MSPHELPEDGLRQFFDNLNKEKIRLGGIIPQTYTDGVPNILHNEIMVWLQANKDLSHENRLDKVKLTLFERTQPHELHHYAAMSFIIMEAYFNLTNEIPEYMMTGVKGGKEIAEHLELERKKQSGKIANEGRVAKFQTIWGELKTHWQNNLTHLKSASRTASILQDTAIYKNSETKPEKEVIARYVRNWKKEIRLYSVKSDFTA